MTWDNLLRWCSKSGDKPYMEGRNILFQKRKTLSWMPSTPFLEHDPKIEALNARASAMHRHTVTRRRQRPGKTSGVSGCSCTGNRPQEKRLSGSRVHAQALSMAAWAPLVSIPLGTVGHRGSSPPDCHSNTKSPVEEVLQTAGWMALRRLAGRHTGRHRDSHTVPSRVPRTAPPRPRWQSVDRQTHESLCGNLRGSLCGSLQTPVLPTHSSTQRWPQAAPPASR